MSRGSKLRVTFFLATVFLTTSANAALVTYTMQRIGLWGAGYRSSNGVENTSPYVVNDQGQVIGTSVQYSGTSNLGNAAWFYDGSTTTRLGLTGGVYTSSAGVSSSSLSSVGYKTFLAGQGFVGTSVRYNGTQEVGKDDWFFNGSDTVLLGLTGAIYQRFDGGRYGQTYYGNSQGQFAGEQARYSGGNFDLGRDAWFYDGSQVVQLGYTGAGYEQSDGYRVSRVQSLSEQGQVTGYSDRYSGSASLGRDSWLHAAGNTQLLGFTGTGYERSDGFRYSSTSAFNLPLGKYAGTSSRFSGSTDMGWDAWLFDGTNTVQLGLTGAGYQRTDGYRGSSIAISGSYGIAIRNNINQQGQVIGTSNRYDGAAARGADSWIYSGGQSVQIGLIGGVYERSDGYRNSSAQNLSEQGKVIGYSNRYNGMTALGQDSWLFNGSNTLQIGLTGSGYTRSDGYQFSQAEIIDEQGQAFGYTDRYIGTAAKGRDAWVYNGSSTTRLGLAGAGYTSDSGYQKSVIEQHNAQGQVTGISERVTAAGTANGKNAWFYSDGDLSQIGMTGAGFTSGDGFQSTFVDFLSDAGQVAGHSLRFTGNASSGSSAWLYDSELNQTFDLTLSVRQSDGYAFSVVKYLGEDGVALGIYSLFDQYNIETQRTFYFTVEDGLYDLGSLMDDQADSWIRLYDYIQGNGVGNIVGSTGALGGAAYILTPTAAVPVPPAVWLFGSALAGLGWVGRRRSA